MKMKTFTLLVMAAISVSACSKKKTDTLTRRSLEGKRVAVATIEGGDSTTKKIIEVALVNEIVDKGRFEIVNREDVQKALENYPAASDRVRLGKYLHADYVLDIMAEEFKVTDRSGLDEVIEADPVMKEEWHSKDDVVAKKYVKVKSEEGRVKLKFTFVDVASGTGDAGSGAKALSAMGSATDTRTARLTGDKKTGGELPGKLALLEELSGKAVQNFFEKLPE